MNTLLWILLATLVNGLVALIGSFSLLMKDKSFKKILIFLVAFSAGALLSGSLFHLIPHALEKLSSSLVFGFVLFGFTFFFILERVLHWHHCHEGKCDTHPVSYLIIVGDAFHNFIDGVIIGVSFIVSIHLGLVTTIIIIAHEIPQELGDFAVMVHGGFSKKKALFYNFLSQLTAVVGGALAYFFSQKAETFADLIVPFAAGGFLYIAASDLIPQLHKEPKKSVALLSFVFFLIGVGIIIFFRTVFDH